MEDTQKDSKSGEKKKKTESQKHFQEQETRRNTINKKKRKSQDLIRREITRKPGYRSEMRTDTNYEDTKDLLEIIKISFCVFPSFLEAHIAKRQGEKLKIIA